MNRNKKIISSILSFFLCILLLLSCTLIFLKKDILNSKYYIDIVQKDAISQEIYDKFVVDIKGVIVKNNIHINEDEIKEIISQEQIEYKINENIDNEIMYISGKKSELNSVDYSEIEKAINDKINSKINIQMVPSDTINKLNDEIKNVVEKDLDILMLKDILTNSNIINIQSLLQKFISINVLIALFVMCVILLSIIMFIWRNSIKVGFGYLAKICLITGVVLEVIFIGGRLSNNYYNAPLSLAYLRKLIASIIINAFDTFILYGVIFLVIGISILCVLNIKKMMNNNNE